MNTSSSAHGILTPEAEQALLRAQMDNYVLQQMHHMGTTSTGPVYVKKPVDDLPFPMPGLPPSAVEELIEEANRKELLKKREKRLVCPEHGNPLLPENGDNPNRLVCTVIGCKVAANKKTPVKRFYETGQKYQMPEVLPQPSEDDQYAAFVALVTLPVEARKQEKRERGKKTCTKLRRLNRMADWQLRHLKEPVFSGSDE